jgi:hypothetical protein
MTQLPTQYDQSFVNTTGPDNLNAENIIIARAPESHPLLPSLHVSFNISVFSFRFEQTFHTTRKTAQLNNEAREKDWSGVECGFLVQVAVD